MSDMSEETSITFDSIGIQFTLDWSWERTCNLEIHVHPFSTLPFLLYYNVFSMSILRVLQKSLC